MALMLFIAILLFYQQAVSWNIILYWPLAAIFSVIATLGLGSWLAALNVKYRDFRYVIPFLIQVLFFLTPIIYPIFLLEDPLLQYISAASPMYIAVEFFRYPLTNELSNIDFIWISLASNIILLIIGVIYFRKTEDFFADLA
jgi:lipopolysaccharide transport system permease protein